MIVDKLKISDHYNYGGVTMDNGFMKAIRGIFTDFSGEQQVQDDKQKLLELVKQAKDELINADKGFDEAADKDLAEYYIYYRKAAEARYNYLIKAAKNKSCVVSQYAMPTAKFQENGGEKATTAM